MNILRSELPLQISGYILLFMEKSANTKRIYGFMTNARLLDDMLSNLKDLRHASRRENVSKEFQERIMMGVTSVNGCEMCSYYHTGESLKLGMSKEEVDSILGGEYLGVPEYELPAILYSQHYAQAAGRPEKQVKEEFEKHYDNQTTKDITAFIRAIMVGNAQGNIAGALKNRIKGKPEKNSSLFKEVSVLLGDIILMPALLLKALVTMPLKGRITEKKNN